MTDIDRLAPAPWEDRIDGYTVRDANGDKVCGTFDWSHDGERAVAIQQFVVMARNAFDVQSRRGWYAVPVGVGSHSLWRVRVGRGHDMPLGFIVNSDHNGVFSNPFEALVAADEWYRQHVEGEKP